MIVEFFVGWLLVGIVLFWYMTWHSTQQLIPRRIQVSHIKVILLWPLPMFFLLLMVLRR